MNRSYDASVRQRHRTNSGTVVNWNRRGHQAAKYFRMYGHTTAPDTKAGTPKGWRPNVAGSGKEVRIKQRERG